MPLPWSAGASMGAKELHVAPIASSASNRLVKRVHYSGKVVNNSQLHLGVYWQGALRGAIQFGPPMDKRKVLGLVSGTQWNEMLELNRMAFGPELPRNSESRALSVAMRIIRREYPHIQWILSFADATQCGDGAIYRASGFVLTGLRENTTIYEAPTGEMFTNMSLTDGRSKEQQRRAGEIVSKLTGANHLHSGAASMKAYTEAGFKKLPGYQMRYIYFLDPTARARLTVPEVPFSKINEMGAGMYLGTKRDKQAMTGPPAQRRGSTDHHAPGIDNG